ncbi:hypothetical protein [Martelella mangrovi]|uniref:Uncharacterized protein n=1 Tax=Martelella mangrovi TaxID=1397477 RepID=A0ABV2IDZ7_9HYPH
MDNPLQTAIALWRAGKRPSLVIFAALNEQGYNVKTLERIYYRSPG